MESAKEKAIREAYGEHWDNVKDYVNERGWCNYKSLFGEMGNSTGGLEGIKTDVLNHFHPVYCYYNRPKTLRGLEENNGWTRIESEADLPNEIMPCHIEYKGHIYMATYHPTSYGFQLTGGHIVSDVDAYIPINLPPKRIY